MGAPRTVCVCVVCLLVCTANCFPILGLHQQRRQSALWERFEDSDRASKGFVSTLTAFVNTLGKRETKVLDLSSRKAPSSKNELLERIRDDYVLHNYLWTGEIDLACFESNCTFTDPTISFTGTDQFVRNIQNLRPIVDSLTNNGVSCQSLLLSINLGDEQYVQTRWNMVGALTALPWKPRIDVIGRTKFWFRSNHRVWSYDEEWELTAWKALLQLVTPAGTIPNSEETTDNEAVSR